MVQRSPGAASGASGRQPAQRIPLEFVHPGPIGGQPFVPSAFMFGVKAAVLCCVIRSDSLHSHTQSHISQRQSKAKSLLVLPTADPCAITGDRLPASPPGLTPVHPMVSIASYGRLECSHGDLVTEMSPGPGSVRTGTLVPPNGVKKQGFSPVKQSKEVLGSCRCFHRAAVSQRRPDGKRKQVQRRARPVIAPKSSITKLAEGAGDVCAPRAVDADGCAHRPEHSGPRAKKNGPVDESGSQ